MGFGSFSKDGMIVYLSIVNEGSFCCRHWREGNFGLLVHAVDQGALEGTPSAGAVHHAPGLQFLTPFFWPPYGILLPSPCFCCLQITSLNHVAPRIISPEAAGYDNCWAWGQAIKLIISATGNAIIRVQQP